MCFGWASFSHLSCTPHVSYPCSYLLFFPFFLLIHLSIHDKKEESILESIPKWIVIFMTHMHILKGRNSIGKMHIPKGRRHFFSRKPCFVCFTLCLFSCFSIWCFELCLVSLLCCSHRIVFMCWTCIHPYAIMLCWLHIQMIICFTMWSLWSFPYDCLVFDQVAHMFHILFTWSLFNCYIILVILLLALPWESNAFCANVSRYKYCVPSSS